MTGSARLDGSRLPFNFVDEAFANTADDDSASSIELEVGLTGRLDESRLREAIAGAVRSHPIAGARMAPSTALDRGYEWELRGTAEVDALRVVRCNSAAELARIRNDFQSTPASLDHSPPFRVLLASGDEGDVLMLNVSHVASDALGALRLLRSIARSYSAESDPVDVRDFAGQRSFDRLYASPLSSAWLVRLPWIQRMQMDALSGAPSRIAIDGAQKRGGYGIGHFSVALGDGSQRKGLWRGATVNDALLAALNLTVEQWNREHAAPSERIVVLMPINLRPEGTGEGFFNFSLSATVSTTAEDRVDAPRLLQSISSRTRQIKKEPEAAVLIDVYRPSSFLPNLWKRNLPSLFAMVTSHRFTPTTLLSNLGQVGEPFVFGSDARSRELWFSPPCRMPLGVSLGALTTGGVLHLSFRYHAQQMSTQAAGRFAATFEELFTELAEPRHQPRSKELVGKLNVQSDRR